MMTIMSSALTKIVSCSCLYKKKSLPDSFFNVNFKLNLNLTQIGVFISKACVVPGDLINDKFTLPVPLW